MIEKLSASEAGREPTDIAFEVDVATFNDGPVLGSTV